MAMHKNYYMDHKRVLKFDVQEAIMEGYNSSLQHPPDK